MTALYPYYSGKKLICLTSCKKSLEGDLSKMGRTPREQGAHAAGKAIEETRRLGIAKEVVLDHFIASGIEGALNAADNRYGSGVVGDLKAQYAEGWVVTIAEMKWQMHQAVYEALEKTYSELCTPGRSALVIPLAYYALTIPTTVDLLRESLLWLTRIERLQARRMNYPTDVPEFWEVLLPRLRHDC